MSAGGTGTGPGLAGRFPVQDRFTMRHVIGCGGMGVVFAARDRVRGVDVALKALQAASGTAISRLKREFRLVQGLEHASLVRLGELWADGAQAFFTMELIEGSDLLSWLREPGVGPQLPRFAPALLQLCDALEHLHAAGVVHRDVKPTNVLVRADGRVKLLDFGIAAAEGSAGDRAGTAGYMAPEQKRGAAPAPAADWYAVGVLVLEALTGGKPDQSSTREVVGGGDALAPGPAPPPDDRALTLLSQLAGALLCPDPAERAAGPQVRARLYELEQLLATAGPPAAPTAAPVAAPPPPRRSAFVGRGRELAVLEAAAAQAGERGSVALVVGASGSGKTRLVRELVARRGGAARVLAARCFPLDRVRFNAVDAIIDGLASGALGELPRLPLRDAAALGCLFPALMRRLEVPAAAVSGLALTVEPFELRARGFAALAALLGGLARSLRVAPLWLVIDDLQWADEGSLALLGALLHPALRPPLLLVATMWADAPAVAALGGALAGHDVRLELGGLDADDTAAMVASLGGGDPAHAARVFAGSGGNPFLIGELARGGDHDLGAALARRLEPSGAVGRALAETVAVAGAPLAVDVAIASVSGARVGSAGVGVSAAAASDALGALLGARVLRRAGGRAGDEVALQHDRLRGALLERLPAALLAARHRELARVLEQRGGASAEQLYQHLRQAGELRRAAEWAAQAAAQAATRLAFERAAELFDAALELGAFPPEQRRALAIAAGEAAANSGLPLRAAERFLAARAGAPPALSIDLARRAAGHYLQSGHLQLGSALAEEVMARYRLSWPRTRAGVLAATAIERLALPRLAAASSGGSPPAPERLAAIDACWSTSTGLFFLDPPRGVLFHTRQLRLALTAGEPLRRARALAAEAGYQSARGPAHMAYARRLLEDVRAVQRELDDDPEIGAMIALVEGVFAYRDGEFAAAATTLVDLERDLREEHRDVAWQVSVAQRFALLALLYRGGYAEERRLLPTYQAAAQRRGDAFAGLNLSVHAVRMALVEDDEPRARRGLRGLLDAWRGRDVELAKLQELVTRSWLAAYGDHQGELAQLRREWAWRRLAWAQFAMPSAEALTSHASVVLALRAHARGAAARAVLAAELASSLLLLGRSPLPWARAWAMAHRGMLAAQDARDPGLAAARLSAAADALRAARLLAWSAAAELQAARVGGDSARTAQAAASLSACGVANPLAWARALLPGLPSALR